MLEEGIREKVAEALRGHRADYIEVRLEEAEATRLHYRGRELEEVGSRTRVAGSARALAAGGWGFVSFNGPADLRQKVELAVTQARLVGKESSFLYPTEPVIYIEKNPERPFPPLAAKKQLLDEYNELIWLTPKIQTSFITYEDGWRRVILANSQGSYIEQRGGDISLRIVVVARDGSEVQQAGLSEGSPGDFATIAKCHARVKEVAERAVALLSAPPVKGGEYTVVLDPVLAGVFIHEAFGHISEADCLYENPRLREIMVLGKRFAERHLNIVDDATLLGLRGSYKYDDEGVAGGRNCLIREGVLVGRLHSRETAARMGERATGNARAVNYSFPPIVRMSNTLIEPGEASFDDLIAGIEEGVYVRNWYGGTTSMEMFTFSAGEAFMIRKGRVGELLRPAVLSGNVFTTLGQIDAIGNDLAMNQGGGCGKGLQYPLPVSNGSPHIRIRKCLVGGR